MKTLIQIVLICMIGYSYAQPLASTSEIPSDHDGQQLLDTFFDLYKNKGYEHAVKYTLSTNKWIKTNGTEMDHIIVKLEKEVKTMGDYLGAEEIKNKKIGRRYRIVSYLVYYQRDPIRFTFALYKAGEEWEITDFQFDSNFDKEMESSIKLAGMN